MVCPQGLDCWTIPTGLFVKALGIGMREEGWDSNTGLHMGPDNLCYVTRPFLFFPYVSMSLFIRPWRHFLQFL